MPNNNRIDYSLHTAVAAAAVDYEGGCWWVGVVGRVGMERVEYIWAGLTKPPLSLVANILPTTCWVGNL